MIVISHPWEFVPNGSSHFNYHSSNTNTNNKEEIIKSATSSSGASANVIRDIHISSQQQAIQVNLHKNHLNRMFNNTSIRKISQLMSVNNEDNNASINEISSNYFQKSPLINNMNFETSVRF